MESRHRKEAQDEPERYEAPAAKALGKVEDLTEGVVSYPSCQRY